MSESVSKPLTTTEEIFKELIWDTLIMAGQTALFAEFPVLNAPVIGAIDKEIIHLSSDWLFEQLRLMMDITAIKFLNREHQTEYDKASIGLKVIAHDKGIDSEEFKNAREIAKIAMSKFTQFGH